MIEFTVPREVIKWVNTIDRKYMECKTKKISRFDPEWGLWSRDMNLKNKGKEGQAYKYLFSYWILRSQLLELHRSRFGQAKKKRLQKEVKRIKQIITTGRAPEELTEEDVKRQLVR